LTCLLPGLIVGVLTYLISRIAGRLNRPTLLFLGLVTLGLYALPFPISSDSVVDTRSTVLFFTSLLLLPALAWFTAAMLLASNASLALSAALLFVSWQHLYWIFAWDATTDPIGVILQIPVMWIALVAALLLVILLWNRRRWVGLTASALFLLAVVTVIQLAMRIDFRQITVKQADQVSQALERRFIAVGSYPLALEKLEPWYLWSVPEPMIIYGLDWCYEGGEDYFHLGYVTREHWSSPELDIRSHSSAGDDPDGSLDCSTQIAAMEARIPGLYSVVDEFDQ